MKVLHDNVFVRPNIEEEKTASGIILNHEILKKWDEYQYGTVVAHGNGKRARNGKLIPLDVSIGDTVFYPRDNFRTKIEYEGQEVEVMKEEIIIYGVRSSG